MSTVPRFFPHDGGTKVNYGINPAATHVQVTLGGRVTGNVIIRYRPYLAGHPTIGNIELGAMLPGDFETPDDNVIALETAQNGVIKRTFKLSDIKLSAIQVDDSGNGTDDIWVHISEW